MAGRYQIGVKTLKESCWYTGFLELITYIWVDHTCIAQTCHIYAVMTACAEPESQKISTRWNHKTFDDPQDS